MGTRAGIQGDFERAADRSSAVEVTLHSSSSGPFMNLNDQKSYKSTQDCFQSIQRAEVTDKQLRLNSGYCKPW